MLMDFGLRVEKTPFTPMLFNDEKNISFDSILQYLGDEAKNVRIAIFTPNQIPIKKFASKTKQFGVGLDGFPDSADFFLFKLFVAQSLVQNHQMNIAVVCIYNYSASCYVIARWLIDERGYKFSQAINALKKALPEKEIDFGLKEKLGKRYNVDETSNSSELPFHNNPEEINQQSENNDKIGEKIVLIDLFQQNNIIEQAKRKPPKPPPLPNSKIFSKPEKKELLQENKIKSQTNIKPSDQSLEPHLLQQNQPNKIKPNNQTVEHLLQIKQLNSLVNLNENSQKQQWPFNNSSSQLPFFEGSPQKKEEIEQDQHKQKQSYYNSNQQKQAQQMNYQSENFPYQYEEIHILNSKAVPQQSHHHDHHHQHFEDDKHNPEKNQHNQYQYYYNQDSYDHPLKDPSGAYNYASINSYNEYYQHEANKQNLSIQSPQIYPHDTNYYSYDMINHSETFQGTPYYDQTEYYSNYDQVHPQPSYHQPNAQNYYLYNDQQNTSRYSYPPQQNMTNDYPPPQTNYNYSNHYPPNYHDNYQFPPQYQNEYPNQNNYNYNYSIQPKYHPPPPPPPHTQPPPPPPHTQPPSMSPPPPPTPVQQPLPPPLPAQNDHPEYHDIYNERRTPKFNSYSYNETSTYKPNLQSYDYNQSDAHHLPLLSEDQIKYPNDQKSIQIINPLQIPPPSPPPLPPPPFIHNSYNQPEPLPEEQEAPKYFNTQERSQSSSSEEDKETESNSQFQNISSTSSIGNDFSVFNRIPIARVGFDSSPDEFVEVCKDIATILAIKNLNIQNIQSLPFTHEDQLTVESFEMMEQCRNKDFMFRPFPAGDRCFLIARGSKRFLISNEMCREVKVTLFTTNSENMIQNVSRALFEGFLIRIENVDQPNFLITDCFNINADFCQLPYIKRLEEAEKIVVMQQSKNNIQDNLLLRNVEIFQIDQFEETQNEHYFNYEVIGFSFFSPNSVRQNILNQFNFNESTNISTEIDNTIYCNSIFKWFKDGFPIVQINISNNMKCIGLARRNGSDELIEAVDFGFAKKTMLRFNKKIVELEFSSNLQKWQIKCISSNYKTWYADDVKNIVYGKEVMPYLEVQVKIDELISS